MRFCCEALMSLKRNTSDGKITNEINHQTQDFQNHFPSWSIVPTYISVTPSWNVSCWQLPYTCREDRLSKHEMPLCFGNQLHLTWLCASCLPGNRWVETTRYFRKWLTVANIQQPMNVLVQSRSRTGCAISMNTKAGRPLAMRERNHR